MIKKAFTLIELLIAIALLGVIVFGAVAFDLASRELLRSTEQKVEILNDATFIVEHITKNAVTAIGDIGSNDTTGVGNQALRACRVSDPNCGGTPYGEDILLIRQDSNGDGRRNPPHIDRILGYAQQSAAGGGEEVIFMCPDTRFDHRAGQDGGPQRHEILTRKARLREEGGGFGFQVAGNSALIWVVLRFDPYHDEHPRDNPQVRVQTTIEVPGYSLR